MTLQTIPLSWATRQASGAVENGLALDRLFDQALIVPRFGDDRDRISPLQLTLLYALLLHGTEDGVHMMARSRLPIEVGQLAQRVLLGSRRLGEGLEAMAKFYQMCFPSLRLNLSIEEGHAFLALEFQDDRPEAVLQEDVQLGFLYLGLTHFAGRPFPLSWVATRDPSHMNIDGAHWAMKCKVRLQSCAGLAFPKSLLMMQRQINDASDAVWDPLEAWISFIEDASPITTHVNNRDLRVVRLAGERGVAPSTYRRLMSKTDRGFREMRERMLIDSALALLRNETRSLEAIAEELGYSDERSFRRFVKRVTGQTPSEIRHSSTRVSPVELRARLKELAFLIAR